MPHPVYSRTSTRHFRWHSSVTVAHRRFKLNHVKEIDEIPTVAIMGVPDTGGVHKIGDFYLRQW